MRKEGRRGRKGRGGRWDWTHLVIQSKAGQAVIVTLLVILPLQALTVSVTTACASISFHDACVREKGF